MIRKLKINKDIYSNTLDFFKKRIVEVCGLILISVFGVFSYSLINYSPNNETLIYKIDEEVTGGLFEIYSNKSNRKFHVYFIQYRAKIKSKIKKISHLFHIAAPAMHNSFWTATILGKLRKNFKHFFCSISAMNNNWQIQFKS